MEDFPIPFIVGVGRSGTTLLRSMLDSHPVMAIGPETQFITAQNISLSAEDFTEMMVNSVRWLDYGIRKDYFISQVVKASANSTRDVLLVFYKLYLSLHNKKRWGDKTPSYVREMITIQSLFPEARFIHIIRDGRDVAASYKNVWFGGKTIEWVAQYWKNSIAKARADRIHLANYAEIRYEDLVSKPTAILRSICEFIQLEWDDSMLNYPTSSLQRLKQINHDLNFPDGRHIPAELRLKPHLRIQEPPQQNRVGVWQHELNKNELFQFQSIAGDLLNELDY